MGKEMSPGEAKSRSAMTAQGKTNPGRGHPTPVITAFLSTAGKIALFKRSNRVSTHRGTWAGVSGYVQRLPLNQAYVELDEETGLSRDDVELCGIGIPVIVEDDAAGRTWMVHPFLFSRSGHKRIAIDWEADSIDWVSPQELGERPTAPGWIERLRRSGRRSATRCSGPGSPKSRPMRCAGPLNSHCRAWRSSSYTSGVTPRPRANEQRAPSRHAGHRWAYSRTWLPDSLRTGRARLSLCAR